MGRYFASILRKTRYLAVFLNIFFIFLLFFNVSVLCIQLAKLGLDVSRDRDL